MAFIMKTKPSQVTLYKTCDIPTRKLHDLERDFKLGAHHGYGHQVELHISDRSDLYDCTSVEDVLARLQKDGTYDLNHFNAFLIYDSTCAGYETPAVWIVNGWLSADHVEDNGSDFFAPGVDTTIKDGRFANIAVKQKLFMYAYVNYASSQLTLILMRVPHCSFFDLKVYIPRLIPNGSAPITYVNLSIANTALQEHWNYPYDPNADQEPDNGGADWRLEPPNGAYVVADATTYTKSLQKDTGSSQKVMRLGASAEENDGLQMYRLKEEVAQKLGLKSSWSPGNSWSKQRSSHLMNAKEEIDSVDESTAVSFMQKWDWKPPALS